MKTQLPLRTLRLPRSLRDGFTLIELLVVIAIIGILAGMLFVGLKGSGKERAKGVIKGQLSELETVIEEYKVKRGMYPPSNGNTNITDIHPLLYELVGCAYTNGTYRSLDGAHEIPPAKVKTEFNIPGLVNAGVAANQVENFYSNLKGGRRIEQINGIEMLVAPVKDDKGQFLVWHYNSVSPVNNPGKYDLWVEYVEKGKATKIGNFPE